MGLFISFEGGEATGKSLQVRLLFERLQSLGLRCFNVHEPGGTRLGEYLRPFIKGDASLTPIAELFLFSAARSQLLATQIEPQLQKATIVIVDRYADSTIAYQGYGHEGNRWRPTLEQVQAINRIATNGLMPDLTVLLDMDPVDALSRRAVQLALGSAHGPPIALPRIYEEDESKFENKSIAFHRRVREGYLRLAKKEPERWFVVDARQPIDTIEHAIWEKVKSMLPKNEPQTSIHHDTFWTQEG